MQYVNAIIAVVLLGLALIGRDDPVQAAMFILAATLAAIAFKHWLSRRIVRVFAIVAAGLMFWHFAQFLYLVPHLSPDWYRGSDGIRAAGLLFAGFAMMPVLSEYSCRMKASSKCERGRRQFEERKRLLDSVRRSQASHPAPPALNSPPRI